MGTITANKVLSDNGTLLFFVTLYFAILQALAPPTSKMSDNIIFIASLTLTLTVRVQLRLEVRHWPSPAGGLESHDLHFQTKLIELLNFENEFFESCFHGLFYLSPIEYYLHIKLVVLAR